MMKKIKTKLHNLLRWSERYTRTDMVYLTKAGSWTGVSKVIGSVTGLGLSIALANLIPQEAFGNYKFVVSLAGIIAAFSLTGMNSAVKSAVARGYDGIVKHALKENFKWSWGMVFLSLIGSAYYFINENVFLSTSLLIVAATLPVINSFNLVDSFWSGKKDFKRATIYGIPHGVVPPLALIATVFFTNNPLIMIAVYFFSQAVIIVATYAFTFTKRTLSEKTEVRAINFSKHLSLMNVLGKLANNLDKILLFHFLGAAPLAVYTFAIAPIREIRNLKGFFLAPAFPKLSRRSIPELKRSLPYRMGLLFLSLIPVVALYVIAAPYIYAFVFPQYTEAVIFSQVFAISIFFIPIAILVQTLTAHLKKRELYITKITTPIARIVFLLALVPFYGIWGAIFAIIATQVVNMMLLLFLFKKLT